MRLKRLSLTAACVVLGLAVLVLFPAVGYFAYASHGSDGLRAAAVAAGVCWLGATAALLVTAWVRETPHATSGMLVAIALRTGLPLIAGVLLSGRGGRLAEAGVFGWILAFFLFTLAVETVLSVALVSKATEDKTDCEHG